MFPATTQASKDTPKEERKRVPSYDKSIQGHPRRKVKRGKKERKKERKRERKGDERKEKGIPATNSRPGTHQRKKEGDPEYSIQEAPKSKERKGGGKGKGGGLSSRQVPMNLEQTSVAATTYGVPKGCHL